MDREYTYEQLKTARPEQLVEDINEALRLIPKGGNHTSVFAARFQFLASELARRNQEASAEALAGESAKMLNYTRKMKTMTWGIFVMTAIVTVSTIAQVLVSIGCFAPQP
jgi:hypothetical protein